MWRFLAVAASLVLAAAPALAQSKAAVQRLDDAFTAAYNKGDAQALAAMYAADAYVLPNRDETAHGRAAIAALLKGEMEHFQGDLKLTAVDVLPLGGNAAREIGAYAITRKGQPQPDTGKYVIIWRKLGGKWLIATDIWNSNK